MSNDKKRGANKVVTVTLTENESQLEDLKAKIKQKGEHLVKEVFPKKVLELTDLIDSEKLNMSRLKDMSVTLNIPVPEDGQPMVNSTELNSNCENPKKRKLDCTLDSEAPGTKVFSIPGGLVPVNSKLVEILDIIKPEAIELVEYANQVKMWITFMIPKIEDGNNFGVSIQEDAISEARQVESEAATYLDQISRYHLTRGKMISKAAKYPHVEDFRRTVQEVDEKEFLSLKLILTELRNNYASLHDLISKNLDKIKKPRSANTDNMY